MKFNNLKNLINLLLISSLFSDAIILHYGVFFEVRLSYFLLLMALTLILPFVRSIYFSKAFVVIFVSLIVFSLFNIYLGKDSVVLLSKQIIGITLNAIVFYCGIQINRKDIKRIFLVYLNFASWVGLIGILQEFGYILNIKPLYDFRYIFGKMSLLPTHVPLFIRVNSIMPEPSSFCIVMMPAFFVALVAICKKDFRPVRLWKCIVIAVSFLLSFSILGYIGATLAISVFVLYNLKLRDIVFSLITVVLCLFIIFSLVPYFKLRIHDTVRLFKNKDVLQEVNLSTYTFYNNLFVTKSVLKDNFLIGHGLGSHELSYEEYIGKLINFDSFWPLLNKKDANSLLLRIISETGLIGLSIVIAFMAAFFISERKSKIPYLLVINHSIFVLFMIRLIRQGNYFSEGFFFFFWLYYYTKKISVLENSKCDRMLIQDEGAG